MPNPWEMNWGEPAPAASARPWELDWGPTPPEPSGRGLLGSVADIGITALKGAIGVPESIVGIADLLTAGQAGKLAEEAGFRPKEAKAILDRFYTPAQQAANEAVKVPGFLETLKAAIQNPSTILHAAVESAPSMLGGGVVARGLLKAAPTLSPLAAGAIGEGVVAAGQNTEQLRQETPTGTLTPEQSALMAGSGALTGLIGFAGGQLAKKFGIADIDTWIAGGATTKGLAQQPGLLKRVTGGALSEGVFEELPQSAQEQIAQNIALGKPWDENAGNAAAMGMLVGGVMGGGANVLAPNAEGEPFPVLPDTGLPSTIPEVAPGPGSAPTTPAEVIQSVMSADSVEEAGQRAAQVLDEPLDMPEFETRLAGLGENAAIGLIGSTRASLAKQDEFARAQEEIQSRKTEDYDYAQREVQTRVDTLRRGIEAEREREQAQLEEDRQARTTAETARLAQEDIERRAQEVAQRIQEHDAKGLTTQTAQAYRAALVRRLEAMGFEDPAATPQGENVQPSATIEAKSKLGSNIVGVTPDNAQNIDAQRQLAHQKEPIAPETGTIAPNISLPETGSQSPNLGMITPELGITTPDVEAIQSIPTVEKMRAAMALVGEDEFQRQAQEKIEKYKPTTPNQEAMLVEATAIEILASQRRSDAVQVSGEPIEPPTPQEAPGRAQPAAPAGGIAEAPPAQGAQASQATSRIAEINAELAKLQAQYETKSAGGGRNGMVPPSIKASALKSITDKMDRLDAEKAELLGRSAQEPAVSPAQEPDVQQPAPFTEREQPGKLNATEKELIDAEKTAPVAEKAPAVRINGQLPAEMTVAQLQFFAQKKPDGKPKNVFYADQANAAAAELKNRDKKGETVFGKTADQLTDSELAVVAGRGKNAMLRAAAKAEQAKRTADAAQLTERLKAPGIPETLQSLAEQAGWAEKGGHLIRTKMGERAGQEKISRTKWIPRAEWWPGRPVPENESYYRAAVSQALAGGKLTSKQTQVVKFMLDLAEYEGQDSPPDTTPTEAISAQEEVDIRGQEPDLWSIMNEDEKENELDAIFGQDTRQATKGAQARAPVAQGEVGQAGAAQAQEVTPEPILAPYTNAEIAQREAATKAAEEAKAKEEAAANRAPNVRADQVDLFNTQGGLFDRPAKRVFYDDAVKAYTATAFDERFGNMHGTGATEELATADLNKRLEAAYRYGTWRSVEHPTQPASETPAETTPTIAEMSPADLLRAAAAKMDQESAPNRSEATIAESKAAQPNVGTSAQVPTVSGDTDKGTALYSRKGIITSEIFETDEANRDKTDELQRNLRAIGDDFTITPVSLPVDVAENARGREGRSRPRNSYELGERTARVFGKEIIWITANGPFDINGVVAAGSAKIGRYVFIDARAEKPAHVVLGHELTHHMEKDAPGVYKALFHSVAGLLRNHDEYKRSHEIPLETPDPDISREIIGDLMGDNFGNPEFWNLIAKESPSKGMFRVIANTIKKWIDRLLPKLKIRGLESEQFVTDMKAAQVALSQAVRDYAEIQRNTGAVSESAGRYARTSETDRGTGFDVQAKTPTDFSRAQDQTQTEAFKKWFGDSKVVDADGKPLVVYHGTTGKFNEFDFALTGTSSGGTGTSAGFFFAADRDHAEYWAKQAKDTVGGRPRIISAFLKIKNPLVVDFQKEQIAAMWGTELFSLDTIAKRIQDGKHDGAIIYNVKGDTGDTNASTLRTIYVVSDAETQIKSIGNTGAFDPNNPDIRFSRTPPIANSQTTGGLDDTIAARSSSFIRDMLHSDRRFGWWERSIGTPQHKALTNEQYKPVYDEGQFFLADVYKYANMAADMALDLLPRIEGFRDFFKKSPPPADVQAAMQATMAGTLYGGGNPLEGRLWTDEELKAGRAGGNAPSVPLFKPLTDAQVKLYREAMNSVGVSLENFAKSLIHRLVVRHGIGMDREMVLKDMTKVVVRQINVKIADLQEKLEEISDPGYIENMAKDAANYAGGDREGERAAARARGGLAKEADTLTEQIRVFEGLKTSVEDVEQKATALKEHGYFPAQRFGQFAIHLTTKPNAQGERKQLYFGLFESQTKANLAYRELIKQYPEADLSPEARPRGMINPDKYKLFQGLSLDALENFADYVEGADGQPISKDPLVQGFLKAAVSERSALKHHIHRKGIAGYSEDMPRVLASFTVSMARAISSNYHGAEMDRLAMAITDGDVQKDAVGLVRYLKDPLEEAHRVRGFLFAQFLGGSLAHGIVNMTQPWMVTAPFLSQYTSFSNAVKQLSAATVPGKLTGKIAEAFERAKVEGIRAPQEIHQLRAETGGMPLAKNLALRKLMFAWGSIYSITEQFNRSTTFLAAYRIAEDLIAKDRAAAKKRGIVDPYEFAKEAVQETQFVYNKGNRPNWFRGPIGATVGTFKQFSISYLELAKRLYNLRDENGKRNPKPFALMMMMLLAASGMEGLPFSDDMEDLIDTIGQWMGFATNSKKRVRQLVSDTLGPELGQIALKGLSGFSWMPVDVSLRMGMQNLIPGSAALKLSEKNKARDVLEMVGPIGQFAPVEGTMLGRALERLSKGDMFGVAKSAAPLAVQNVLKGGEMFRSGVYKDTEGKKIVDTTGGEAAFKMFGLQPASVARESQRIQDINQDTGLQRRTEDEIAEQWARGRADNDPAEVRDAMAKLVAWNRNNPELRIRITTQQIRQRVNKMRIPRAQRTIKSAPPELRAGVREALR